MLVLDDYHEVDTPEIQGGMVFLLEHLPPRIHLVITTRADPALPLGRLRGRGGLTEIRAADLRFTPTEAAAYLNEVMGLDLGADDVAALEGRTEGWIAALQLAAISMQGRDDVAGFIAGFAGDDRYIVDYLVEEVLRRQPAQIRTFLLETSILDRLSARTLRRRHRSRRWAGDAAGAGPREPVPRRPRRPPPVVPLPPAVRRRAPGPSRAGATRAGPRTPPPGECVVREERCAGGGDPARHGGRRLRAGGDARRTGDPRDAPGSTGDDCCSRGCGPCRTTSSPPGRC